MALSAKTIKTILAIKDNVSPGLKNINRNFKALNKATTNLSRNLGNVARMTVLPLVGSFAAVGASIKSCVNELHQYGTSLFNTSKALGIASDDLAKFRYIATLSGSSAEQMDAGLRVLNKTIANAAAGKNKEFIQMLEKLHISLKNADGSIKTSAELLPELAEAMKSQTTQAQKAYIAQTAFGKSGADLIQTLERGKEGFAELSKDAEKYGLVIGEDATDASLAFDDAVNHQNAALQGLKLTIGKQLIPVIAPLMEQMNEWIAQNRQWIATEISKAVKDFAESLRGIDFRAIITGTVSFIKNAAELFNRLGGLKTIGAVIASIFAGKLVLAVGATVKSLWTMVSVVRALSVALIANPIGLVITAVAALGYAAYELYQHWDTVKAWFVDLWDKWGDKIKIITTVIMPPIGILIAVVEKIIENWDKIKTYFSEVWDAVSDAFTNGCKSVEEKWNWICSIPDLIPKAWDSLKDYFKQLWADIKGFFFAPFEKASNALTSAKNSILSTFGLGGDDDVRELSPVEAGALAQTASDSTVRVDLNISKADGLEVETERTRQTGGAQFNLDTGATR